MAIGGDSAGGNLAAAACLAFRGSDRPSRGFQLADLSGAGFHHGTGVARAVRTWLPARLPAFQKQCHDSTSPAPIAATGRISPLLADDVAGVPPGPHTHGQPRSVARTQAEAYAARLVAFACVPVDVIIRVPGAGPHSFMCHGMASCALSSPIRRHCWRGTWHSPPCRGDR